MLRYPLITLLVVVAFHTTFADRSPGGAAEAQGTSSREPGGAGVQFVVTLEDGQLAVFREGSESPEFVSLGSKGGDVVVDAEGRLAYVAVAGKVLVVDLRAKVVAARIAIPGGSAQLAIDSRGRRLYAMHAESADPLAVRLRLTTVDTSRRAVVAALPLDEIMGGGVVVSTDGRRLFTCHAYYAGRVLAIDTAGNRVAEKVNFEQDAGDAAISPDGRRLFITQSQAGSLVVLDTSSGQVTSQIEIGRQPGEIALSPDGRHAYVCSFGDASVIIVDVDQPAPTATIPVHDYPLGLAVSPRGDQLWVLHNGSAELAQIDARSRSVRYVQLPAAAAAIASPQPLGDERMRAARDEAYAALGGAAVTVRAAIGIGAAASVLIGIFAAALLVRVRGGALALAPLALLLGIASAAIVARVASLPAEQAALVYSGDWPPEIAFGPWFAFTTAALPCLAAGLFALLLFPGRRRLPAVRRDT